MKENIYFFKPKLNELENSKINNIAKESLINEIIKKTELKSSLILVLKIM